MTAQERWQQVEALCQAALERDVGERAAFLASACREDEALRHEVETLLEHANAAETFLATSLGELAANVLAEHQTSSWVGRQVGPYEILSRLGSGGMGDVYRARDTRLGRDVAIKVAREGFDERVEREARSIAALNHPHICTLHDVGPNFLVMELVEGETLADVLRKRPITVEDALLVATQVTDALGAAHTRGIVHRDLKPGNVMITPAGAKVLDFGLATLGAPVDTVAESVKPIAGDVKTAAGQVLGTVAYMAPEQVEGKAADARSDVFSFGVLFYEMLSGRRPFDGETPFSTAAAILQNEPNAPSHWRPGIPKRADRIVLRCLQKRPEDRYSSAIELHRDLLALRPLPLRRGALSRAALIGVAMTLALGAAAFAVRGYLQQSRIRWVTQEAVPEMMRLINANQRLAALELFRQAENYSVASASLNLVRDSLDVLPRVSFETTPPGARVYISDYTAAAGEDLAQWKFLGIAPFESGQIPRLGYFHVRAVKEGFSSADLAITSGDPAGVRLTLRAQDETPAAMKWVPDGVAMVPYSRTRTPGPGVTLPGFWMDTLEVTNGQFEAFVDAGGYKTQQYWTQPFIADGHELSWDAAMERFRDSTGRPGPKGWQLGTFPDGTKDLPVAGVSWYEAAAYASFVGKNLPTVYEWFAAAGANAHSDILTLSNFGARGPAPVGAYRGMARFGSYDMAGNVKEWIANPLADRRGVLGGAWDEAPYMFVRLDARTPMSREATIGFRLVRRVTPVAEAMARAEVPVPVAPQRGQPVDDATFRVFERFHAYDKTELEARIERTVELPYGRREVVTFRTAYGSERMAAHLILPKLARPPYQIVALFGTSGILSRPSIEDDAVPYEFIVRSGRAVIVPVYFGSFERGPSDFILPPGQERDRALHWSMDLGRSLDYLETRADINIGRLGFYGVSMGAAVGPRLIAVDKRFNTAILASGGMYDHHLPEVNVWNFLPRVRIPVLMLNGRDDFIFPYETHQRPLFDALGTKEPDKVFHPYDGGHANLLTRPDLIKEILDWLDKYLGPVEQ